MTKTQQKEEYSKIQTKKCTTHNRNTNIQTTETNTNTHTHLLTLQAKGPREPPGKVA